MYDRYARAIIRIYNAFPLNGRENYKAYTRRQKVIRRLRDRMMSASKRCEINAFTVFVNSQTYQVLIEPEHRVPFVIVRI